MLEEAMVIDALSNRLDEEGNVIETDADAEPVADIEAVEILKDAADVVHRGNNRQVA